MIEITFIQAVSASIGIFGLGIGTGYKLGERKVVTTIETRCSIWSEEHTGSPTVVMMNTKRVNNNCPEYKQSKKLCRLNNKKCKLID